ncbi:MAG: thiamine pyrophosphate-binding protein [Acidobacteriota bacterium]
MSGVPARGKHVFMEALRAHGIDKIFGNPGTTESPLMDCLEDYPEIDYVLTLHESVACGAAHYYAQAGDRVGVVNLHVGPGLGNALGMLYNAWEANTPLLVTAGQQDTRMRLRDPLLSADLAAMARPLVKWSAQVERADEIAPMMHRALKTAMDPAPGPVFLSLPIDVLEQETRMGALAPPQLHRASPADPEAIERAAEILLAAESPTFVVGDGIARTGANAALLRVVEALGARVFLEGLVHRLNFPIGHRSWRPRMPLNHAGIRRALEPADVVVLIGGSFFEEIWFDDDAPFPEGAKVLQIEDSPDRLAHNFAVDLGVLANPALALEALAAHVEGENAAHAESSAVRTRKLVEEHEAATKARDQRAEDRWNDRPISNARLMRTLAEAFPDDGILVNESITAGGDVLGAFELSDPTSYYGTRGGGIGQALPGALGVSLAHPGRPVVALSGDGSAMYSAQALWSAAHSQLPIVFVILHNREYKILKINMDIYRERFGVPADRPYPHMDLTEPEIDFVALAQSLGVDAVRIDDPGEIDGAFRAALASGRPWLLDVSIEGRI